MPEASSSDLALLLPSPGCAEPERLLSSISSLAVAYRQLEVKLAHSLHRANEAQNELAQLRRDARAHEEVCAFAAHERDVVAACNGARVPSDGALQATLEVLRGQALHAAAATLASVRLENDDLRSQLRTSRTDGESQRCALADEVARLNSEAASTVPLANARERVRRAREHELSASTAAAAEENAALRLALREARAAQEASESSLMEARLTLAALQHDLAMERADGTNARALAAEVQSLRLQLAQLRSPAMMRLG